MMFGMQFFVNFETFYFSCFLSKVWGLKKYLFWIPFWVNKKSIVLLVIHLRQIRQITVSKFSIFYGQSVALTNVPSSTPAESQPPVSQQPAASQPPVSQQPAASHRPSRQSLHPPSASQPPASLDLYPQFASRQPVLWRVCQTQISPSRKNSNFS